MSTKPPPEPLRIRQYFHYLVQTGAEHRWGPLWWMETTRVDRLEYETDVIETAGFCSYYLILAQIMQFMRNEGIVYGPGRGSVGGSLAAYVMGIHEIDSLEYELYFERFLNPDRVSYPDVDIDVSQRHRQRLLDWIRSEFEDENTAVLQVAAFARSGARTTIDMVATAKRQTDPDAEGIAVQLKKLLPEGNITGGTKQPKEIAWWIENGKNSSNQQRFEDLARGAGWWDLLMKLDGVQTHLAKHAAGVVIIARDDMARLPLSGSKDTESGTWRTLTGYDMYDLDDLKYLKIDILGLRTLDIVSDSHIFCGGDGTTPALMEIWRQHKHEPEPYQLLCDADTTGVFQVETSGYRKTLKDFQPREFDHIVQLNALYRPGALDSKREDGKSMVDVYIARRKREEVISYPDELKPVLTKLLDDTQGIILYQEQSMAIARQLAGFSLAEADELRKAIGKKKLDMMAALKQRIIDGMIAKGHPPGVAQLIWGWIEASGRYSWNKSHSVFYGLITWWTAFFKANAPAPFYAALINSLEKPEKKADAVSEARQHVNIEPPHINIAEDRYIPTPDHDGIVFGLNGIKGMGEANRHAIMLERLLGGPFQSFADFHARLPSVPINMKLSLIQCGAFDSTDDRSWLLARIPRPSKKNPDRTWTVAEFIKHNTSLKNPRPLPSICDVIPPTQQELASAEMEAIGFYVTNDPMADVNKALARLDHSRHWGGEVVAETHKPDKNGNAMGRFTLLTPSLNKQRVMIFASDWPQCQALVHKGARIIVRGRMDGSQVIGEAAFVAGDYRHFKVMKVDGDVQEFDGRLETVEILEGAGRKVILI